MSKPRPPMKFKIDGQTGEVTAIYSPASADILQALVTDVKTVDKSKKRASHVLPVNPLLKRLFRWLRDKYGEKGIVAAFTRKWPCRWEADMSPSGGKEVFGPFWNRDKAIAAEIAWINEHVIG